VNPSLDSVSSAMGNVADPVSVASRARTFAGQVRHRVERMGEPEIEIVQSRPTCTGLSSHRTKVQPQLFAGEIVEVETRDGMRRKPAAFK